MERGAGLAFLNPDTFLINSHVCGPADPPALTDFLRAVSR